MTTTVDEALDCHEIAANWLSTNILSYALLFAAFTVLMGLATAALLSNLGRRR